MKNKIATEILEDKLNDRWPESFKDALLTDPLLQKCIDEGMTYPEIIGALCDRHGMLLFEISARKIVDIDRGVNDQSARPTLAERTGSADLLEWAWGIIANAGGGNWELESQEWREAAARWRDAYHGTQSSPNAPASAIPNPEAGHE